MLTLPVIAQKPTSSKISLNNLPSTQRIKLIHLVKIVATEQQEGFFILLTDSPKELALSFHFLLNKEPRQKFIK